MKKKKEEYSTLSHDQPRRIVYGMHVDNIKRLTSQLETMWEATIRILEGRYWERDKQRAKDPCNEDLIARMEAIRIRRLDAKRVLKELAGLKAYLTSMQANPHAFMAELSIPNHLDHALYNGEWWVLVRGGKYRRLIEAKIYNRDNRVISTYVIEDKVTA